MSSRGTSLGLTARTTKGLVFFWTALFLCSLLLQYAQFSTPSPVDAAHNEGIFELDGNAMDSGTPGADWENGAEGSLDQFFVGEASEAAANDSTYFTTGGSKDENDIPAWAITTNSVPDKDELLDAYAAVYESGGDTWVYFGADRFDNDGDAQIGFWFFQNKVGISGGDFTGEHADGDVLILSEYTNGGVVDLVCAYEWDGSGGGGNIGNPGNCDPATNGSNLNLVAAGVACDVADGTFDICALTNDGTANAPWPFTNKDGEHDFATGQFFEGGINLSDMFGGEPPCFGTFLAETRSSQETDAQLKDFALGSLDTCVPPDIETHVQQNGQNVSSINKGESVVDVATFNGDNGEVTGTAKFFVCGPAQSNPDCSNGGTKVGATKTINSESATSDPFTPTELGRYCFRVEYTPAEGSQYRAGEHTNLTTECFRVIPADVQIVKTPNSGTVSAGTDISFTLSWTNEGEGSATGVVVTDTLPTGGGLDWSISNSTGTGSVCTLSAADVLTCNIGTIAGNPNFPNPAPVNGTVTLTSATTAASCAEVNNTGQITSNNDGTDTDPGQVTVLCPDVTVAKTPDGGSVNAGETATFTIVVTNLGPGAATGVTLTDNLPAGYTWTLGGADAADCSINTVPSPDVLSCNFGTLADNETRTITLSAPTTGGKCDVIPNIANVAATNEPAGATGNNSDPGDIDVKCAVIEIEKTANPVGPVNAGDTIGFDITVTNSGDGAANDVSVTDNLPAGIDWSINPAVDGCSIGGSVGAQVLTCTRDSLAGGAHFTVHIEGVTDPADCGTVDNTATVTTGNDGGDSDDASVVVRCPDVQAIKVADASPVSAGDPIGFTVTIKNNGTGTAYDATASDTLPAGITWTIDGPANGWSINAGVLSFGPADLAAGASASVHIVGTTDPADCGVVPNTVTVDATNESNDPTVTDDNSATSNVTVNCPDVTVLKSADNSPISAGDVAAFTILVTNLGPGTAKAVTLADPLPAGITWTEDSADCSIASNVLICAFGDLAAGATRTIHVTGETVAANCGVLPNTATVAATNEAAAQQGNNESSASITVNCPEISITKTADPVGPVLAGATIGFNITVTNNGAGTAANVTVTDALPAGISWVAGAPTGDTTGVSCSINTVPDPDVLTCTDASMAPGDEFTVRISGVTDEADCGVIDNEAFVTTTNDGSDDDDASVTVRCPEIDLVKDSDDEDGIVAPGQVVTFTILAEVVDGPVTNAVITDELPDGQTYVDGSQTSSPAATFAISADGSTLTWTYASLDTGDPAATITYDVTIDADAFGPLTNVAELCVAEIETCESDDETVTPQPGLVIDKSNNAPLETLELPPGTPGCPPAPAVCTADLPTADEGETVTYTLNYTLTGNSVTNGIITDELPDGVTYVPGSASSDDQFIFVDFNITTPGSLTWKAATVSHSGTLSYDVTIDDGAAELDQPLRNVATIDSDQTEPDEDDSIVFVPTIPLEETAPPTDVLDSPEGPSAPGSSLLLVLAVLGGIVLAIGFVTPVPAVVRRRNRR